MIAQWMGNVEAGRSHFLGGIGVNNAVSLERLLGIPTAMADNFGPISAELTTAAAEACRDKMLTDLALAVSDLPPLDREAKESARVFFALATPAGTIVRSTPHAGHPSILKARAARQGLNLVRLALLRERFGLPDSER
jgi:nicotinamide-nucleotide amidase